MDCLAASEESWSQPTEGGQTRIPSEVSGDGVQRLDDVLTPKQCTAFSLFEYQMRDLVTQRTPNLSYPQISILLRRIWDNLGSEVKKELREEAKEQKKRLRKLQRPTIKDKRDWKSGKEHNKRKAVEILNHSSFVAAENVNALTSQLQPLKCIQSPPVPVQNLPLSSQTEASVRWKEGSCQFGGGCTSNQAAVELGEAERDVSSAEPRYQASGVTAAGADSRVHAINTGRILCGVRKRRENRQQFHLSISSPGCCPISERQETEIRRREGRRFGNFESIRLQKTEIPEDRPREEGFCLPSSIRMPYGVYRGSQVSSEYLSGSVTASQDFRQLSVAHKESFFRTKRDTCPFCRNHRNPCQCYIQSSCQTIPTTPTAQYHSTSSENRIPSISSINSCLPFPSVVQNELSDQVHSSNGIHPVVFQRPSSSVSAEIFSPKPVDCPLSRRNLPLFQISSGISTASSSSREGGQFSPVLSECNSQCCHRPASMCCSGNRNTHDTVLGIGLHMWPKGGNVLSQIEQRCTKDPDIVFCSLPICQSNKQGNFILEELFNTKRERMERMDGYLQLSDDSKLNSPDSHNYFLRKEANDSNNELHWNDDPYGKEKQMPSFNTISDFNPDLYLADLNITNNLYYFLKNNPQESQANSLKQNSSYKLIKEKVENFGISDQAIPVTSEKFSDVKSCKAGQPFRSQCRTNKTKNNLTSVSPLKKTVFAENANLRNNSESVSQKNFAGFQIHPTAIYENSEDCSKFVLSANFAAASSKIVNGEGDVIKQSEMIKKYQNTASGEEEIKSKRLRLDTENSDKPLIMGRCTHQYGLTSSQRLDGRKDHSTHMHNEGMAANNDILKTILDSVGIFPEVNLDEERNQKAMINTKLQVEDTWLFNEDWLNGVKTNLSVLDSEDILGTTNL